MRIRIHNALLSGWGEAANPSRLLPNLLTDDEISIGELSPWSGLAPNASLELAIMCIDRGPAERI